MEGKVAQALAIIRSTAGPPSEVSLDYPLIPQVNLSEGNQRNTLRLDDTKPTKSAPVKFHMAGHRGR
jgi:hypothetical protein